MSRIFKVGVELEGGWSTPIPFNDVVIYRDGSVNVFQVEANDPAVSMTARDSRYYDRIDELTNNLLLEDSKSKIHMGEIASLPLPLKKAIPWVEGHYPKYVNSTCGMHVHTSFKHRLDMARLMDEKFWKFFGNRMRELADKLGLPPKHHFRTRLSGNNSFCEAKFVPLSQYRAKGKSGSRYTQLNFCYSLHGTIECRLFPAFESKDMAIEAINALAATYEEFLEDNPRLPIKNSLSYVVDEKRIKETLRGSPLERLFDSTEDEGEQRYRMRDINRARAWYDVDLEPAEPLPITVTPDAEVPSGNLSDDPYDNGCDCVTCTAGRQREAEARGEIAARLQDFIYYSPARPPEPLPIFNTIIQNLQDPEEGQDNSMLSNGLNITVGDSE